MKLFEIISSAAFVYCDEEIMPDVVISISGDYFTGWYRGRLTAERPFSEEWHAMDDGPIQHGCSKDEPGLGTGGLYNTDAAQLHDAARTYLREIADPIDDEGRR